MNCSGLIKIFLMLVTIYFVSSDITDVCPYITGTLTWPKSTVGSVVTPEECTETSISRTCLKDYNPRPYWSQPTGIFTKCEDETLYLLVKSNDSECALLELKNQALSFEDSSMCPMQVHYSALILQHFSKNVARKSEYWSTVFFRVIDLLINSSAKCLFQTQNMLNSTDIVLESIDSYLEGLKSLYNYSNYMFFFRHSTSPVQFFNGWIAYDQSGFLASLSNDSVYNIIDQLKDVNPIVGVTYNGNIENFNFAVLNNINLFNDQENLKVYLWVARIFITNFTNYVSDPVLILFGQLSKSPNYLCVHWVYGQQDNINIFGSWQDETTQVMNLDVQYVLCEFKQSGYYGLLVHEESIQTTVIPNRTSTDVPIDEYYCPEEFAEHLNWPKSLIGTVAIPMECTETIYSRFCSYNFNTGPYWEKPSGKFKPCENSQTPLYELTTASDNEYAIKQFPMVMGNIWEPSLCAMKIHYTALILQKCSHNNTATNADSIQYGFFWIIYLLLTCSQDCLLLAQMNLNSTDIVLDSIHSYFNNFLGTKGWSTFFDEFSSFKQQIEFSAVGLLAFPQKKLTTISSDVITLMDIINENREIAVYISDPAIVHGNISFEIFYSTSIFQNETNIEVHSKVVSITTNFNEPLTNPIQIIFSLFNLSSDHFSCAQWRYGRKNNINTFGYWYSETNITEYNQNYIVCTFANLEMGYFGLINIATDDPSTSTIEASTTTTIPPRKNEFCAEESLDNLTWPRTPIGAVAIPWECSETIYSRKCIEDPIKGAFWAKPYGNFRKCRDYTNTIYNLVFSNDSINAIKQLAHIASKFEDKLPPMIIKYSALIMRRYSQNTTAINLNNSLNDFFRVIDNILDSSQEDLADSQFSLNSTDTILESLDMFLNNFDRDLIINRPKYFIRKNKLSSSSVGWTVYKNITIHPITSKVSLFDIINEEPIIAACFSNYTKLGENVNVSFVFFADTKLFNNNKRVETYQWLASVDISNNNKSLTYPLHIIFKPSKTSAFQGSCAYWLYGQNKEINIFGSWYSETDTKIEGQYLICNYTHMTHFGMIINEIIVDSILLEIITYISPVLSLLGVLLILGTLYFKKNHRSKKNICLLLNYLLLIILLPIAILISNIITDKMFCRISGMFLHYIIITQSAWTLILATFQYRRYVIVYQNYQKYILNKSIVIGWLTGTIPVIIVASISLDNYHKNKSNLCYLSQNMINYAVISPSLVISLFNLIIFILIMHNITSSKNTKNAEFHWQILKLAHFLFYLFGLSWVFGIWLIIEENVYISYVFTCLTSLQGFCICIHYIISAKNHVLHLKSQWNENHFKR